MELEIYSPQQDGYITEIRWNNEELKQEIAETVKHYSAMVYTENEIKIAKADRAKLNKFVQALEDKRKEVKKQCLAPYEKFEKQIKEITAIVNEPIGLIDKQIKDYDEAKKEEKLQQIKEFYSTAPAPFDLPLEKIFNKKWLNTTVSMTTVQTEIFDIFDRIEASMETLQKLPEFSFEAIEVYKETLDINRAIQEGQRLADIQRRKLEAERKAKADAEAEERARRAELVQFDAVPWEEQATPAEEPKAENRQNPRADEETEEQPAQWIGFQAKLTVNQALALRDFFTNNNIEFKPIQV